MSVDPTALTPKTGAGLPVSGAATPPLLRPPSTYLIGGTLPPAIATFVCAGTGDYQHHANCRLSHARMQTALRSLGGHIAVFGDSNTEALDVSQISPFAANYGIAGDTIDGLVARLRESPNPSVAGVADYAALSNAAGIVLANFPFNDICVASPNLTTIETNYATLLSYFTGPLVIIPPVPNTSTSAWNTNINTFNTWLNSNYGSRAQTAIVTVSDITTGVLADGQHWDATRQSLICSRGRAGVQTLLR